MSRSQEAAKGEESTKNNQRVKGASSIEVKRLNPKKCHDENDDDEDEDEEDDNMTESIVKTNESKQGPKG